ncbi:hypothetical protein ACFPA1_08575 [Neobacillus sp. GCM10023253]|uniref:hypothetical protein n=1 Tax=Neobacillus sp. GCM10023253 TaxID=3252644 RepID=UPI00361A2E8A
MKNGSDRVCTLPEPFSYAKSLDFNFWLFSKTLLLSATFLRLILKNRGRNSPYLGKWM